LRPINLQCKVQVMCFPSHVPLLPSILSDFMSDKPKLQAAPKLS
jgi:hypothetical protein